MFYVIRFKDTDSLSHVARENWALGSSSASAEEDVFPLPPLHPDQLVWAYCDLADADR